MILVWLKTAVRNRFEQISFIAQENPAAALRIHRHIDLQIEKLKDFAEMGREGRVAGTRELVIHRSPLIAVYRVQAQRIEILRILHGAQLWPKAPVRRK